LFGTIRQQHDNNTNPTPIQFIWAFKKIFCLEYFRHSPDANCNEDMDNILFQLNEMNKMSASFNGIVNHSNNNSNVTSIFKFNPIKIVTIDYRQLNIPETSALTYISDYLMKK